MIELEPAGVDPNPETVAAVDARDRLLRDGAESLSAAELLGLVLRENARTDGAGEIAGAVLRRFGGLRATATRTIPELMTVPGIGPARATRLKAAFALASAASRERLPRGAPLRTARDDVERFHDEMRDQKRETFYSILLDGKNRIIREDRVSQGSRRADRLQAYRYWSRPSGSTRASLTHQPSKIRRAWLRVEL